MIAVILPLSSFAQGVDFKSFDDEGGAGCCGEREEDDIH